jgi:hypothetical protein
MTSENEIDLPFVKERYIISNNVAGIANLLMSFVSGNGRKLSTLFVNNKEIDIVPVLLTQLSDDE